MTRVQRPLHPVEGPLRVAAGVPSVSVSPMPEPGDRHPGFIVEPMQCWAMVYDGTMQADHLPGAAELDGSMVRAEGRPLVAGVELCGPH
jgi:hypothetical protein